MKKTFFVILIFALLLTACGKPAVPTVDPAIAALEATIAVQSAASTLVALQEAQTQAALPPTPMPTEALPTAEPTIEPTQTEVPVVRATANVNSNCRLGPYANFAVLEVLNQGAVADVIGQNATNGQWWKVKLASGSECWIFGSNVTVSGDTSKAAQLVSPATPTPVPAPTWGGTWTIWFSTGPGNPDTNAQAYTISFTQTGNALTSSFATSWTSFNLYGTVSADGMSASGNMVSSNPIFTQPFIFNLVRNPSNLKQFRGGFYYDNRSNDGVFCGYKDGAGYPTPCRP